ncbi:MAG: flagellar protein FliT [Sterolibacterium sp.]
MAPPVEAAMNNTELLSQYEEIWRQSCRMNEAARQDDWDLLVDLELNRAKISKTLMPRARKCAFSQADQARLAELIRNILACDEETRLLIIPRQQELKAAVGSIDTEKKLQKAYAMTW